MSYACVRSITMLLCFTAFSIQVFAQTGKITGQVKDATGQPLAKASVQIQSGSGTSTDDNGYYSLTAPVGKQTLIISFVGYATQKLVINVNENGSNVQDAVMAPTGELGNVTIVGSRSAARTRTETPVPVDVIPLARVLNDVGQVDLNQILTFIAPSFQSSRQTVADGTDHMDPAQLRSLGTDQVLVLINGKRRHQASLVNVNGTINRGQVNTDLSAIPASAIERVEILRDGAAAQYGSDAIAGVINIVLKKNPGVLEAGVSYGEYKTEYAKNYALYNLQKKSDNPNVKVMDGKTTQANLGYGFTIKKGHLNLNGEYIHRDPTNRTGTYTGQIFPNVNGVNRDDSIIAARGLTRNTFDLRAGNSGMKSGSVFYNFGYPVDQNGEFYAFGGWSKKNGEAAGLYRYPSSIVSGSNAGKYASSVFAIYPNGFLPLIESDITDFSTAVGFRTKINEWNFDLSNTYGVNVFDFGVKNSINYSQMIIPGNSQTSFDAGGLKFYENTANLDLSRKVNVLQGMNFATGAEYRVDAFGIRTGEEASYKNYDVPSGVGPGAQVFPGFVNTIGSDKTRKAEALYVDVEQDFTRALLLTGALRYEHFSDFGSTFNYKFSGRYKVAPWLNLRASASSGFRAPSLQQRYYAKTNTLFINQSGSLVPVQAGTFTNDSKLAGMLGIPKLKEETSRNYSVGLTASPFKGLELTVDAYQINIKNRIILTNNFTGATSPAIKAILDSAGANTANFFTNAIDTKARGIEAVLSYAKTIAGKHTIRATLAGTFIDNQVKKDANGRPIIHASDILVNGGQLKNYFNREDESRVELANPKNKISLMLNYHYTRLGVMVRFVRFGQVTYWDGSNSTDPFQPVSVANAFDNNAVEITDQTFKPKVVTDLSLSYDITRSLSATIGANNLFDVYQDIQTHSSNQSLGRFVYSRRVEQMGYNGSYFFARLRLTLNTKQKSS
ncbi:MAG: TonB-dependent receptor [Flavisolibacter sp.]